MRLRLAEWCLRIAGWWSALALWLLPDEPISPPLVLPYVPTLLEAQCAAFVAREPDVMVIVANNMAYAIAKAETGTAC
jgi:hypothetical protein